MAKKTTATNNFDLKKLTIESIKIAKKASSLLLKYQSKISKLKVTHKEAQGVASEADVASERLILKELQRILPGSNFLAEEDWHTKKIKDYDSVKNLDLCWVVDPLDGTHNFLNGSDYYSICISLVDKGEPLLGVVLRPVTGEYFYSYKGEKSFYVNAKKKKIALTSSKEKNLKEALLITGFATEKGEMFDREFDLFKNMMGHCRGVRRFGSAALDICYVALGLWDGFWERGLAPWDVAASGVIAKNAGLVVSDYEGRSFDPYGKSVVVASQSIHDQMVQHLK